MKQKQNKYTPEQRKRARDMNAQGFLLFHISEKLHIPRATVDAWVYNRENRHKDTPERREYLREYQRKWVQNRRQEALKGKKCSVCGSKEDLIFEGLTRMSSKGTKIHSFVSYSAEKRAEISKNVRIVCVIHTKRGTTTNKRREKLVKMRENVQKRYENELRQLKK